jgi:hypothetical protein
MDSIDFYRTLMPTPTRDDADALLTTTLLWIGKWAQPDRVFDVHRLDAWATTNGYAKEPDNSDLINLLRQAYSFVTVPSALSIAINDAIVAHDRDRMV